MRLTFKNDRQTVEIVDTVKFVSSIIIDMPN